MVGNNNINFDYTSGCLEKYIRDTYDWKSLLSSPLPRWMKRGKVLFTGSIHLAGWSFVEAFAYTASVIKKISTFIFMNLANTFIKKPYILPSDCSAKIIRNHCSEVCKYAAGTFVIPILILFKGFESAQSLYVGESSQPTSFEEAKIDLNIMMNKGLSETSLNQVIQNRIERYCKNKQYENALLFVQQVKNEEKKEKLIEQILNDYIPSNSELLSLGHYERYFFKERYSFSNEFRDLLYMKLAEHFFQKGELNLAFGVSKLISSKKNDFKSKINDNLYIKIAEAYLAKDDLYSALQAASISFAFRGEDVNLKNALISAIVKVPLLDKDKISELFAVHNPNFRDEIKKFLKSVFDEVAMTHFKQGNIDSAIQFAQQIDRYSYSNQLLGNIIKECSKISDLDNTLKIAKILVLRRQFEEGGKYILQILKAYFEKGELDKILQIIDVLEKEKISCYTIYERNDKDNKDFNCLMVKIVDAYVSQNELEKAYEAATCVLVRSPFIFSETYIEQAHGAFLKIIDTYLENGELNKAKKVAMGTYVHNDLKIRLNKYLKGIEIQQIEEQENASLDDNTRTLQIVELLRQERYLEGAITTVKEVDEHADTQAIQQKLLDYRKQRMGLMNGGRA